MPSFAFYLLKVIICSGVMLLYYKLALRNKKFHYYNRFYLLSTVFASLLLPLVQISGITVQSSSQGAIALLNVINATGGKEGIAVRQGFNLPVFNWQQLPIMGYAIISCVLTVTLLWRVYNIYKVKKRYSFTQMAEFDFVQTNLPQAPFTFLRNLFWRSDIDLQSATGRQVLQHELTHIRQKHTWDKLGLQVVTAICWANPFFWFIKKELNMLHEFIADEKAIENNDGAAFAAMLLTSQYGKNVFAPVSQFSYSPIKRRLFMLTNSSKPRYTYLRRLMALPLIAAVALLFAFKLEKKHIAANIVYAAAPFKVVVDAGHGGDDAGAEANGVMEKSVNLSIAQKIKELAPQYGISVALTRDADIAVPTANRTQFALQQNAAVFVSIHLDVDAGNPTSNKQQLPGLTAYVSKQNAQYAKSVLLGSSLIKSLSAGFKVEKILKERAESVYVLNRNTLPAILLECGYINRASDVKQLTSSSQVELMARKILEGLTAYANAAGNTANAETANIAVEQTSRDTSKSSPLFVVDGKITEKAEFDKIKPSNIASVSVLKNETATKKYGARGINGVIEIVTKTTDNSTPDTARAVVKITNILNINDVSQVTTTLSVKQTARVAITAKTSPMYLLNGKAISDAEFKVLDPKSIKSVHVLKDKTATDKYGDKAKDGVVEIFTDAAAEALEYGTKAKP
jgi:N-acetylmuramoyl-L-alanine amidase